MKTLEEILASWKPEAVLSKCGKHGISKWQVIDYLSTKVYMGKPFINDPLYEVKVRDCRICGTEFDVKYAIGSYIVRKACSCSDNGKKDQTLDKLKVYLDENAAQLALNEYNLSKTKGFKTSIRSWISQGFTEDQAQEEVRKEQASRSVKSPATQKGARGYSVRTMEYWVKNGFTEDEAKLKVSGSQVTNGLDWYIEKYGQEEGTTKFNDRMASWNSKMTQLKTGKSKVSEELFTTIDQGRGGLYGKNEKVVRVGSSLYRADYVLGNKIIEFHGDYWHANPKLYEAQDIMIGGKTAQEVWDKNAKKEADLKKKGYDVLIVWEDEFKTNKEAIINECIKFLSKQ